MADPIKIRAAVVGEFVEIRLLMQHPMENGQRKDASGRLLAPHFIQQFSVSAAGKTVIGGELNASVSRNPLFVFRIRGPRAGDRVTVHWKDSEGEERSDETSVLAA